MSSRGIQSKDIHSQKDRLYHNAVAPEYDEVIVKPRQLTNNLIFRNFKKYFHNGTIHQGRALDLGCGTGHMTLRFGKYFNTVDLVDNSEAMLAQARKNLSNFTNEINFIHNNYVRFLPQVQFEYYDAIFCTGFLHHLKSTELRWLLGELYRVLCKNGFVLISEPIKNVNDEPPEITKWNAKALSKMKGYSPEVCKIGNEHLDTDEEPLDKEWFVDLLHSEGFHIKKQMQSWEIYSISGNYLRNHLIIRKMFKKHLGTGNIFTILLQKATTPNHGVVPPTSLK